MIRITLKCWTCGKEKSVDVEYPPDFAFELAGYAQKAKWLGVIDMDNHRSLVFCSNECMKKALKKDGSFYKRAPYLKEKT